MAQEKKMSATCEAYELEKEVDELERRVIRDSLLIKRISCKTLTTKNEEEGAGRTQR